VVRNVNSKVESRNKGNKVSPFENRDSIISQGKSKVSFSQTYEEIDDTGSVS